ncbi:hypothetical protein B0H14DRAFT_2368540 [Mycena olivaceomarginata]|nr:hypothetical protein B0H14DRAFT_2368540 [Mycena olivaceomarginata]
MVGNRRHIPREQKDLVIVMSARKTPKEIAADTMMDVGTVRQILRLWRTTGSTVRIPLELGRPRILTALEVDYLEGLVIRTPDIYTFELQHALFLHSGLKVSKNTIRDAIIHRGYTRKTVSDEHTEYYDFYTSSDFSFCVGSHAGQAIGIPG